MKSPILYKILLILITLSTLACGASKRSINSETGESSRGIPTEVGRDGGSSTGVDVDYYAECNSFSSADIEGVVTTYFDPYNNSFVEDLIRMEISQYNNQLTEGTEVYFQFFRWSEEVSGQRQVNQTPVSMFFQLDNGQWLNTTGITSLSKNTIQQMISQNSLSTLNINVNNFLSRVVVVLTGMDLSFDAVTIAMYDNSQGTSAISSVDVLLPAFAADPNLYAQDHPSISLQQLHPNYSARSSGASEWDYFQMTQQLCL